MPMHRNDRRETSPAEKPSVVDLVTDPEKFDQWQRQREREEARDDRADPERPEAGRSSGDPREPPPDRG